MSIVIEITLFSLGIALIVLGSVFYVVLHSWSKDLYDYSQLAREKHQLLDEIYRGDYSRQYTEEYRLRND